METVNDFIRKYNISEKDLYVLAIVMHEKQTGVVGKVIKGRAVLKPYQIKYSETLKLMELIKKESSYKDQMLIDKYGQINTDNLSSSNKLAVIADLWSSLATWQKVLVIVLFLWCIGTILEGDKPEPCGCADTLQMSAYSAETYNVYPKWKKCHDAYGGPATATLKCMDK